MDFKCDWEKARACVFRNFSGGYLHEIRDFDTQDLNKLLGLGDFISKVEKNTLAFMQGKNASNTLIWGARGCGKSSIIKGVLGKYLYGDSNSLRVVEIEKKDIEILPFLIDTLRDEPFYFVVYCDDLSFEVGDKSYKSLKSVLEGSLEKRPQNVLMYATSNRRHLLAEAQEVLEIHQNDVFDEIISLSDRFGLSMGIYTLGSEEYLEIVKSLCESEDEFQAIRMKALNYATSKGNRSGRSAKEFYKLYKNNII